MQRSLVVAGLCVLMLGTVGAEARDFQPLTKSPDRPEMPAPGIGKAALDCSQAIDVSLGDTVCGDTTGLANEADQYCFSPWNETGGEIIYRLVIDTPARIEVSLDAQCDLDVALLASCDASDCLILTDLGFRSSGAISGEYFIVVDGYVGAACGFCLTIEEIPVAPPIDLAGCTNAEFTNCLSQTITGTTCGETNHVTEAACGLFPEQGQDKWYTFEIEPFGYILASANMPNADVSLWVFDDCLTGLECLGFSDFQGVGGYEAVVYSNTSSENKRVHLVVDSFGAAGDCAEFEIDLTCSGGVVPVQQTSWGTLKGTFSTENGGTQ